MPPAARVGDPTAHGTPLTGVGCPTVLIGGMPAWRALADFTPCPLVDPSGVPHAGGIAQPGQPTVLIGSLPASVMGDTIVESSVPNTIVGGCPTVMIG